MVTFACVMGLIFGVVTLVYALSKLASCVGKNLAPAVSNAFLTTRFDIPKEPLVRSRRVRRGAAFAGAAVSGGAAAYAIHHHGLVNGQSCNANQLNDVNVAEMADGVDIIDRNLNPAYAAEVTNVYHGTGMDPLSDESFGRSSVADASFGSDNSFGSDMSFGSGSSFDSGWSFGSGTSFGSDSFGFGSSFGCSSSCGSDSFDFG